MCVWLDESEGTTDGTDVILDRFTQSNHLLWGRAQSTHGPAETQAPNPSHIKHAPAASARSPPSPRCTRPSGPPLRGPPPAGRTARRTRCPAPDGCFVLGNWVCWGVYKCICGSTRSHVPVGQSVNNTHASKNTHLGGQRRRARDEHAPVCVCVCGGGLLFVSIDRWRSFIYSSMQGCLSIAYNTRRKESTHVNQHAPLRPGLLSHWPARAHVHWSVCVLGGTGGGYMACGLVRVVCVGGRWWFGFGES